jgi:hypothetical protein
MSGALAIIDNALMFASGSRATIHVRRLKQIRDEIETMRDLLREARSGSVERSREDVAWDARRKDALS